MRDSGDSTSEDEVQGGRRGKDSGVAIEGSIRLDLGRSSVSALKREGDVVSRQQRDAFP